MPTMEGFRVATAYVALTISEDDIQAQIEEAVTAACQQAGDDGGTLMSQEIAAAVDGVAPDLSAPLIESLASAGDAAAADIADSLTGHIGAAGEDGGAELAGALADATAEVGTDLAARIGGQLEAQLPDAASASAADMATQLTAGTAHVGTDIAARIGEQLTAGLDEAVHSGVAILGQLGTAGAGSTAAIVAAGAGVAGALSAAMSDAASEAGAAAGAELSRNLSEAAVAALSDEDFEAFTAMLVSTAAQAGSEAGVAAAESLGTGFASVDLIAAGLSTVGEAMGSVAHDFTQASDEMIAAERTTLRGTQAYEAELDAMFEAIYRDGDGMTVRLAAAMVEAFQGIEADTEGFSAVELSIFEEFYQTLEEQGDAAALSMAERVSIIRNTALLGQDLVGQNLSSLGGPMPAATTLEEELNGVGKAAGGAAGELGGMAGVMSGSWMWGILGAVSILPMFSSLLGGNSQAAQQAAQDHQQLLQAVSQDSNAVGDNTTAIIQNTLAKSDLSALSQQLGLTQVQLIEYAAGEKDVQDQVTAAYLAQSGALKQTADTTTEYGQSQAGSARMAQLHLNKLNEAKDALDKVTSSVKAAITEDQLQSEVLLAAESSTQIYAAAVQDLVVKQQLQAEQAKMQAEATKEYLATLVPGTQAYTDVINEQMVALQEHAIKTQINAQALNDSLPPQSQLTNEALAAGLAYQNAGAMASQYKMALDGLYGQYGDTSAAQAQFTVSLDGLNGKITAGRNAVDLHTEAGAKNFLQFKQVSDQAFAYAEQLYKQTGDAGKASGALQDMAGKLDDAAKHAHLTTQQVKDLNTELFGVPDIKNIKFQMDLDQAKKDVVAFDKMVEGIISSLNGASIHPSLKLTTPALATGGPVRAGAPVIVGDGGRPEVFVPNSDGRVYPSIGDGARAMAAQGAGGGQPININYYGTQQPTIEQQQIMMRDLSLVVRGSTW